MAASACYGHGHLQRHSRGHMVTHLRGLGRHPGLRRLSVIRLLRLGVDGKGRGCVRQWGLVHGGVARRRCRVRLLGRESGRHWWCLR